MKRAFAVAVMVAALSWAQVAMAQSTPAGAAGAAEPTVSFFNIGVVAGAAAVENVGIVGGVEAAFRLKSRLDVVVDGGWIQDVVTRRKIDQTAVLAQYIQTTRGVTASSEIEAPAWYASAGLRWVFERDGALRPYVSGQVGVARVEYKPTFIVGGTAVANVADYGVTLGSDLSGTSNNLTYGGGAGVILVKGAWYFDLGGRVTRIQTDGQPTTVGRVTIGVGRRF